MTTTANEYKHTPSLNTTEWARFRRDMLMTGTYNPERWDELDSYQKAWTKDTLNTLRSFEKDK